MSERVAIGIGFFWAYVGVMLYLHRYRVVGAVAHYLGLCQCGLPWRKCDGYPKRR